MEKQWELVPMSPVSGSTGGGLPCPSHPPFGGGGLSCQLHPPFGDVAEHMVIYIGLTEKEQVKWDQGDAVLFMESSKWSNWCGRDTRERAVARLLAFPSERTRSALSVRVVRMGLTSAGFTQLCDSQKLTWEMCPIEGPKFRITGSLHRHCHNIPTSKLLYVLTTAPAAALADQPEAEPDDEMQQGVWLQ